mmetsp:Transcript_25611/g.59101  ORF Transcript_25611/g.59101 Transcript_25611/m.59101 type:complete len:324 (-) Transcript_25611:88-1059(-)|eukprot:CAMPEP_0113298856 /NCGR_PEP_ID=MMETSP0010_2-20120614/1125_1 /TAXON_ID=216773 ORGANISM="Corethron hystrix, Strain 308" /NCGR_SAMPLE_ID=MMETSP0010_2 /ASSEMBLY_ACC=CAM_ASM_000155 /LENGTH=323 /DNA_ID=CAMNT_0000151977 /DNA_START=168 /DNA_END=1139 /DNA_ORIENTATION=+ /assembly_acc=CAM_ASM_000155
MIKSKFLFCAIVQHVVTVQYVTSFSISRFQPVLRTSKTRQWDLRLHATIPASSSTFDLTTTPKTTRSPRRPTDREPLRLRIRKARLDDLDAVSHLLSLSLIDADPQMMLRPDSLRYNMHSNRLRSSLRSELSSRYDVLDHADAAADIRALWASDPNFRRKLRRAVNHSPSLCNGLRGALWLQDETSCLPVDRDLLYHAMIVAEDTRNGSVVGFCEVAMLPRPGKNGPHVPTLLNVVSSTAVRRRGVGDAIVGRALAYVTLRQKREVLQEREGGVPMIGSRGAVGLYVHEGNIPARSLYEKHGFAVMGSMNNENQMTLYMEKMV